MKLPEHIHMTISHNAHKVYYQTVEGYLEDGFITAEDFDSPMWVGECIETDEIWVAQIYPNTPVGFYTVAAPTLQKLQMVLAAIAEAEEAKPE